MNVNKTWQNLAELSQYEFQNINKIDKNLGDLISIGADLETSTLIKAYSSGYFPMEVSDENGNMILGWFSPIKRGVLPLGNLRITKSMKKSYNRFTYKIDQKFEKVMRKCKELPRKGGWINDEFIYNYTKLHELGFAHSVEVYEDDELVGGLYGVSLGAFFAGESMFSTKSDASKVALIKLIEILKDQKALLLDTKWLTPHLASLGAIEISRNEYSIQLNEALIKHSMNWAQI